MRPVSPLLPSAALCLTVAAGCAAPVDDLNPTGTPGPGPGPGAPAPGPGPDPGPGPSQDPCADWAADRTAADLRDLHRIGFQLASVRLEGRVGAPIAEQDGYRAPLDIDRVWFGPSFLEGSRVLIHFDESEVRALTFPAEVLVGINQNAYPTPGDDGEASWWSKDVIVPAADRSAYADLLGYRTDQTPWIAVVQIVAQDDDRTRFRVVERLAEPTTGEIPAELSANWSRRAYAAPFPGPSDRLYIASLSYLSYVDAAGLHLAQIADLRPRTPEAIALVEEARARPPPALDGRSPPQRARAYLLGWSFHRATDVVAANVRGIAGECCTGLGGTYFAYDVAFDLRARVAATRIMRGGHGYYSEQRCGDGSILGLEGIGRGAPAPEESFSCDPAGAAALPTGLPVPDVVAELPDTADNRAQVSAWLGAREPLLRLAGADHTLEASPQDRSGGVIAPWSVPPAMAEALAFGSLISIDVADVQEHGDTHEVTLETTFASERYAHLDVHRVKVAFRCGDRRLLQKGARWLAPLVTDRPPSFPTDRGSILDSGAFLVPGVMLPDLGYVKRIAAAFGYAIRR